MSDVVVRKNGAWVKNGKPYVPCDQDDCQMYSVGVVDVVCISCSHNDNTYNFYEPTQSISIGSSTQKTSIKQKDLL